MTYEQCDKALQTYKYHLQRSPKTGTIIDPGDEVHVLPYGEHDQLDAVANVNSVDEGRLELDSSSDHKLPLKVVHILYKLAYTPISNRTSKTKVSSTDKKYILDVIKQVSDSLENLSHKVKHSNILSKKIKKSSVINMINETNTKINDIKNKL